ncbi:hypothetical protein TVAG_180840 [Trichomonas vaginalis G3]|uniref:TCTP domain-containing protein n=1 Tax=Trichomonas vaginalis (strain ATCC PRA-98 / G3) TaxID=412133 RepID=A2F397_TRIV3|nr:microtubule binding [Trichomonas vaginalis G3]EAY00606.1 hypothetical protein TVAG_180840 [Trichomonas vaginalis G3]KAI5492631.1 microtubule binding [Trichomonas vaginalis G3]|eukprot:XP_001313535.1 hypothetical protein [Trichomonas vaginalis G3]
MRYYASPIEEDELVSDAYKLVRKEDIGALEFEGDYIEVDVEEGETTRKDTVMNIPYNNNLQKLELTKAQFGAWCKKFIPARKAQLSGDAQTEFMQNAKKFVMWVDANFKEFDFFVGPTNNVDDMMLFCKHDESGAKPYFYLIIGSCPDYKY